MERKRLTRLTRIYAPPGLDWPRTFVWFGTREIENTFSWAKTDWQTRKTEKHSPADLRAVAVAAELGAVWECHSALSPWTYHKPSNPKVCCYPLLSFAWVQHCNWCFRSEKQPVTWEGTVSFIAAIVRWNTKGWKGRTIQGVADASFFWLPF